LAPEDWENVLVQAADLGCRAVQFIGGEPTMYPALPRLIEQARLIGFTLVEIYTNGTLFKPKIRETFVRHKVHLAFSVYSADAQIHDLVTQQHGSFDETRESIRWALASGLPVRAGIIEMEANADGTERTRQMLHDMGVSTIGVDRVRGIGRGGAQPTTEAQLGELCGACSRGKITVTSTGEIFPCPMSRFWPIGSVHDGLRAAVEGVSLRSFKEKMQHVSLKRSDLHGFSGFGVGAENICAPGTCVPDFESCNPEPCNPPTCAICNPDFDDDPEKGAARKRDIVTS
jgi:hypothetical protein